MFAGNIGTGMTLHKGVRQATLGLLILAALVSAFAGIVNALGPVGSQDNQWGPSRYLLHHASPYGLYLHHGGGRSFILSQMPNYPASGLVFLWPYAALGWPVAKVLWLASNLGFTALLLYGVFRISPRPFPLSTKLLIGSLFLCGTGWRNTLGNGQHGLFTTSLLVLAALLCHERRGGAWLPLAASWLKYTIALPMSLFFVRSKRGGLVLLGALLAHLGLTLFCAAWTHATVGEMVLGPLQVSADATRTGAVDVFAIATRLGVAGKILPSLASLSILAVSFLAMRRDEDVLSCLSTGALTSLVVVFHLPYDFVVLVLPLAYALSVPRQNARTGWILGAVAFGWFLDKAFDTVAGRLPASFDAAHFWLRVVCFYVALLLSWRAALQPSTRVSSLAEEGA